MGCFQRLSYGRHGGKLAREFGISRELQDAGRSAHSKARKAIDSGRFRDEIVPVVTEHNGAARTVDTDEQPRVDASAEGLASLQPTFDRLGSVIAGNASSINDGAAAVMMMSEAKALERAADRGSAPPAPRVDPALMGEPVHATRRCLERPAGGWTTSI